jgi:hypothetical protein
VISELNTTVNTALFSEQKESYRDDNHLTKKKEEQVNKSAQQKSFQKTPSTLKSNDNVSNIINTTITEINFDNIVNKWKSFVDFISQEKGLTLAPALQGFNLISLTGNKLKFNTDDEQNKKLFEMNENYIEKKSEEFFGKRLKFNCSEEKATIKSAKSDPSTKLQTSKDPFEQVILNELGGEKIQ